MGKLVQPRGRRRAEDRREIVPRTHRHGFCSLAVGQRLQRGRSNRGRAERARACTYRRADPPAKRGQSINRHPAATTAAAATTGKIVVGVGTHFSSGPWPSVRRGGRGEASPDHSPLCASVTPFHASSWLHFPLDYCRFVARSRQPTWQDKCRVLPRMDRWSRTRQHVGRHTSCEILVPPSLATRYEMSLLTTRADVDQSINRWERRP